MQELIAYNGIYLVPWGKNKRGNEKSYICLKKKQGKKVGKKNSKGKERKKKATINLSATQQGYK